MAEKAVTTMIENKEIVLYNSLKAIFLHIDNHEKALFSEFDLTLPRFYILLHLSNHPGINYIELSDLMLCTKGNTTRIVQSMQKDGLVQRVNHPADGRSYQLFLTVKGKATLERVLPQYNHLVDSLMSQFDDNKISYYTEVSKHIESTLAPKNGSSRTGAPLNAANRYGRMR
ncbi:MAG TPA: MarR family transcriptional regulator [Anaerolineaceae bacterium]|nr:MarR family transcriptional regulator [Anaerolineaceae bacterium]